ncbi:MAG: sigma-70 family RNA polymerase sigma factor [Hyphomicrobiaceae bacterium]
MFDYTAAIAACARGDKAALRALFDTEAGRLVAVAQRIVRRREIAEDVVQDAFVQIWQNAPKYDPSIGSARGWIYTIVRNKALNVVRDSSREDLVANDEIDAAREGFSVVSDAFERLSNESRLRECLEMIEKGKRESLLLSYVAGYSHGEIAGLLGVPLGTAKSWVKRGLAALRECMA